MKSRAKSRILRTAVLSIFSIFCLWTANHTNSTHIQAQKNSGNGTNNVPFSLSLYGSNAALTVANSDQLNSNGSLTVEAWIKISDVNGSQVIIDRLTNDLSAGNGGYQLLVENGRATFRLCSSNILSSCIAASGATTIQADRWKHIAAVYEPGQMRVYLDGRLDGQQDRGVRAPGIAAGNLTIGSSPRGVNRFQGLLDEIRISNAAIYTTAFNPSIQPAINQSTKGLWRFDNGSMSDWSTYNHQTSIVGLAGFSPDVPVGTGSNFVLTETPNIGPRNQLADVVTISPTDVWAVGYHGPATQCCFPATPVALHYDGTQWNSVSVPFPDGSTSAQLISVDAASPTSIWAVGSARFGFRDRGWLAHWNGINWSVVTVFNDPVLPEYGIGTVESISVISDNDLWVVGGTIGLKSWTLHWDGTNLTTIPSPNVDKGGNTLHDVSAISSNDVWAVGSFMAIRWNGTEWQIVPGDIPRYVHLNSVSAVSSNEVWAVGNITTCGPFEGCSGSSNVIRFDGTNWSFVPVQPIPNTQIILNAVSASGSNDVWVVGSAVPESLILHYENGAFVRKPSQQTPSSDSNIDYLQAVSALTPDTVFTVGYAIEITNSPHTEIGNNLALTNNP